MTRHEILGWMEQGHKATHHRFMGDEYIMFNDEGDIITEDGYNFNETFFNSPQFETGWSIFE